MENISILTAFSAGIISFISPCVFPLIPPYICLITGFTLDELIEQKEGKARVLVCSLFFVAGFSIFFVILGCSASIVGKYLLVYSNIIRVIMGIVVTIFALYLIFPEINLIKSHVFKIKGIKNNYLLAFVLGLTVVFAWAPCVGPILGSILMLSSKQETIGQGAFLLTIYSMGLGIPFIITGITFKYFFKIFREKKIQRHFRLIKVASGVLLIIIGLLIITDNLRFF